MERFEEGLKVYQSALKIDPQLFHMSGFGTIIRTAGRNEFDAEFLPREGIRGDGRQGSRDLTPLQSRRERLQRGEEDQGRTRAVPSS